MTAKAALHPWRLSRLRGRVAEPEELVMRILVLGGGGREHAIVHALVSSIRKPDVLVAPGNGGTAAIAKNVPGLDIEDPRAIADFAAANAVDLVVIGPEGPLVAGVADALHARKVMVFGPSGLAARLEGSKAFAKGVMRRHGIPTGESRSYTARELSQAQQALEKATFPIVVKADGLAAGKGVTIAKDRAEAEAALRQSFGGAFGEAGETVLIEEFLDGPECSLLAFVDGNTVTVMPPAQDHKRAFDGDTGPNTGGMGVYSPVPGIDDSSLATMQRLLEQTVRGLYSENIRFRGVLYGGFVITSSGPKVLEYNARFGDPETQVLLPRLKTDLIDVMLAVAEGRLDSQTVAWSDDAAVCVVLAAGGYPGEYEKGKVINGIEEASAVPGVTVYHAGTTLREDGVLVTNGGRVLGVTALAPTLAEARERAYEAAGRISFEGMQMRSDIAIRAVGGAK
jgi:phosphoribosylamine--glycine ligase